MSNAPVDGEELKRKLGKMRAHYRANAPAKVAEIESLWGRVLEGDADAAMRGELVMAIHTLVGSAPTLGCEELGAAAGKLEAALRDAFEHGGALSASERDVLSDLVAGLGASLA